MIGLMLTAALADPAEPPPRDTADGVADTAEADPCWMQAFANAPQAGAVDVPIDLHPSVRFEGCSGTAELMLALADTRVVLAEMTFAFGGTSELAVLKPEQLLPANTDLVLFATSFGYPLLEVPFRTGEDEFESLEGILSVEVLDATWVGGTAHADLAIRPLPDPSGVATFRIEGPHGVSAWATSMSTPPVPDWAEETPPDRICFDVFQIDAVGGEYGPARACRAVDAALPPEVSGCGCASSPGGGDMLVGALALITVTTARRRSRR